MSDRTKHEDPPKFGQTIMDDLRQGDLPRSLRQDFQETYDFYLDDETREQLSSMSPFQKWLYTTFWMLKSMFFKLSSTRRILLLVGLVMALNGLGGEPIQIFLAFLLLFIIVMLEQKDKLLARGELESGRAVQLALMPARNPSLPGWETWLFTRPANDVGGDLVDYLRLDGDRVGISLGDVAGKGLPAALFMAKLQATLRALAPYAETLATLGDEINDIFRRDGLPNRFASLVYLEVEAESGLVRLLNAGHLPPIAIREESVDEMDRVSPALGLMSGAPFQEQHIELLPGDMLLVYSDGLTEARNEVGMFFDDDRLLRLLPKLRDLSAEEAGKRLLSEVDWFAQNARPSDDLSIALLKRV